MKISIEMTQTELDDYIKCGKMLRDSPCRDCPDNSDCCCGCPAMVAWNLRMSSMRVSEAEYNTSGVIKSYVEAKMNFEEACKEVASAQERLHNAEEHLSELSKQVSIIQEDV